MRGVFFEGPDAFERTLPHGLGIGFSSTQVCSQNCVQIADQSRRAARAQGVLMLSDVELVRESATSL